MAAITRTVRGLVCELELTATDGGVPTDCIVNFDNIHIIPREAFRRHVVTLEPRGSLRSANASEVSSVITECHRPALISSGVWGAIDVADEGFGFR